jgi:DNA-binding NarL/FixJ family response regulator
MTRIKSMNLPERCREVAKLAVQGMTGREIANALQLSTKEVKACLDELFRKGQGE